MLRVSWAPGWTPPAASRRFEPAGLGGQGVLPAGESSPIVLPGAELLFIL